MLTISLQAKLSSHRNQNLLRKRKVISHVDQNHIVIDGKTAINFCSNDYLGLAQNKAVKKACIQGIEEYGFGSASSPLISGYYAPQQALEEAWAEFLGREKALYFNSGYAANTGIFSALLGRENTVLADKLVHASIIDGLRLSRAKFLRYQHNDLDDLENQLKQEKSVDAIVTESIFSMEGDIAPLDKISDLAEKYNAMLVVDDAHGIGVLGKQCRGIIEYYNLPSGAIDCLVTPLGKACGGIGAIVSGSKEWIESIFQFSRTYHYATALPPAMAMANLQALRVLQNEKWRREKLDELVDYFTAQVKVRGLSLIHEDKTPIKVFSVQDNVSALRMQQELLDKGFYVSCIRPPTVPDLAARLRISLNCFHEENQIDQLLDELMVAYGK
jgi:8-amino-7-oxononanoate synthase